MRERHGNKLGNQIDIGNAAFQLSIQLGTERQQKSKL